MSSFGTTRRRDFLLSSVGACVGWRTAVAYSADEEPADQPTKRYRVIDTHLHLFNSRLGGTRGIPKLLSPDATIEGAVAAMRQGGVDKAFLITYNAQDIQEQFIGRDIDPATVRLVYNTQYQKTALKKHPELFWWFPDHMTPFAKRISMTSNATLKKEQRGSSCCRCFTVSCLTIPVLSRSMRCAENTKSPSS